MVRGIEAAAKGMITLSDKLDSVTNNLANISTPGFKRIIQNVSESENYPVNRVFLQSDGGRAPFMGYLGNGSEISTQAVDLSAGGLEHTSSKFDVAITLNNNAFFQVQTPNGIRYTRDGNFTLNNNDELVTQDGYPVLSSANAPITIDGQNVVISSDGSIQVDGQQTDTLGIVSLDNPSLIVPQGSNLYNYNGQVVNASNFKVLQGYLESSNVNTVREMVDMIALERAYESGQKAIVTEDNETGQMLSQFRI
ncbi:flagellar hook-basal body protein [Thermodesulfobium narugense DSM 14796]|uniref:Flagellar hook-basal body protein n=1 Tax=Thermodesulfobium narugense DSM 14796 TaxID=747365 RepID=M1E9H9_9BACT|nr:flagellar hook-basal body protein [Thermodesulfobium narugense]AEE15309.1 flagellar hook-basal body protein [Thermodesulfobium narugense DSM 14796]